MDERLYSISDISKMFGINKKTIYNRIGYLSIEPKGKDKQSYLYNIKDAIDIQEFKPIRIVERISVIRMEVHWAYFESRMNWNDLE